MMKNRWYLAVFASILIHVIIYCLFYHSPKQENIHTIEISSKVRLSLKQFASQNSESSHKVQDSSPKKMKKTSNRINRQLVTEKKTIQSGVSAVTKRKLIGDSQIKYTIPESEITEIDTNTKPLYTNSGLLIVDNTGYLSKVSPVYPRRALQRKQEGKVIIDATIDISGLVANIQIYQSSGYKTLDQSALKAVKRWKFKPLAYDGKHNQVVVRIPINFQLQTLL